MQAKFKIKTLPRFRTELRSTFIYIYKNLGNKTAALSLHAKVLAAIEKRSFYPLSFAPCRMKNAPQTPHYKILVGNYIVLYAVLGDIMEIRHRCVSERSDSFNNPFWRC